MHGRLFRIRISSLATKIPFAEPKRHVCVCLYDLYAYVQHERMRSVHKVRYVSLRRGLQAQLTVGGDRIVHEHDGAGEFAVVQHLGTCVCMKSKID